MTGDVHVPQEDLTLFAMQTLSMEEEEFVRLHLAECAPCRAALAEVFGDLALVAMTAEPHPLPQGARQRFLQRIGAPAEVPEMRKAIDPLQEERNPKLRRSPVWIPWAAMAALFLIVIGLSLRLRFVSQELQRQSAQASAQRAKSLRAREVLDLLTTPSAQHVLLIAGAPHPAPSARAVYAAGRGALILQASNLKPLDTGKTYELWLIPANGSAPIPAGLFRPDAAGSADLILPKIPEGIPAKAFGVTIESAGGSTTPTAPILLSGATANSGE